MTWGQAYVPETEFGCSSDFKLSWCRDQQKAKTQAPHRTWETSSCVPLRPLWLCSRRWFGGCLGKADYSTKVRSISSVTSFWLVLQVHMHTRPIASESPDTRPAASSSMARLRAQLQCGEPCAGAGNCWASPVSPAVRQLVWTPFGL